MPDAQRRQRILDPDAALDDDVRGDFARPSRANIVGGAAAGNKYVGVRLLDAQDRVDSSNVVRAGCGAPVG